MYGRDANHYLQESGQPTIEIHACHYIVIQTGLYLHFSSIHTYIIPRLLSEPA